MRGKVAKRIRKSIYGDYASNADSRVYGVHTDTGAVHAHLLRQHYQKAKRAHTRHER